MENLQYIRLIHCIDTQREHVVFMRKDCRSEALTLEYGNCGAIYIRILQPGGGIIWYVGRTCYEGDEISFHMFSP
jgi:hypothetical protein